MSVCLFVCPSVCLSVFLCPVSNLSWILTTVLSDAYLLSKSRTRLSSFVSVFLFVVPGCLSTVTDIPFTGFPIAKGTMNVDNRIIDHKEYILRSGRSAWSKVVTCCKELLNKQNQESQKMHNYNHQGAKVNVFKEDSSSIFDCEQHFFRYLLTQNKYPGRVCQRRSIHKHSPLPSPPRPPRSLRRLFFLRRFRKLKTRQG